MSSVWSDEEYSRVAVALLYPPYRRAIVTYGHMLDASSLEYTLNARLQAAPEASKVEILAYADQVKVAERAIADFSFSGRDGVKKVDRIEFFELEKQRADLVSGVDRLRALLSSLVDCPVNPNSPLSRVSGGVCGTCT